jgi:Tfp pilus assembly protein PilE
MRDNKGFTLIEILMNGFALSQVLMMVAIIAIQASISIPEFTAAREDARFAAMKSDLQNLVAHQAIYYLDGNSYSAVAADLAFTNSDGVTVSIDASSSGWSGTATHAALGAGRGCSIYFGTSMAPASLTAPSEPSEVVCTS